MAWVSAMFAGIQVVGMRFDSLAASPPMASAMSNDQPFMSAEQARQTVQELIDSSLQYCPRAYEGDKHWGDTKKVWAGIRVGREGLRITTHRRWKEVKHGLQTKYEVSLPGDPNAAPPIYVQVHSVTPNRPLDGGLCHGWKIHTDLIAPLDFKARIERWTRGLQFYSVEVTGKVKLGLKLVGRLDAYPDYGELPPAVIIDPSVEKADLTLMALDVDRVSKLGGEVAEQWGELVEKITRAVLLDDFNERLPDKLNRAIDKKRDRLRLSITDWIRKIQPS
ncbi:hypothetical protein [Roseiconus lacunae]|uniref:hypothetical protein n=1 Tax=Roseiconus lacunae TaxID=2605694 RepID=UPI001357DF06|nr:hypothetical protein [Roseiconus lacunae]